MKDLPDTLLFRAVRSTLLLTRRLALVQTGSLRVTQFEGIEVGLKQASKVGVGKQESSILDKLALKFLRKDDGEEIRFEDGAMGEKDGAGLTLEGKESRVGMAF